MAQGSGTAADVPGKYDVVINGFGYQVLDTIEPSLPFRSHRAIYGISPTFIERTNISGAYGDNNQDFWLTYNQNDWSLGEQQRFFRPNGADSDTSKRRYWAGTNLEVTQIPGQVSLQTATSAPSFGGSIVAACGAVNLPSSNIFAASSTNLYEVTPAGVVTDHGAHGAGDTPGPFGLCSDGGSIYIAGESGNKVRKWNGSAFSTFSTVAGAQSIIYLNNALYVLTGAGTGGGSLVDSLQVLNSSGTATSIFQWKTGDGLVIGTHRMMAEYGGDLLIFARDGAENGAELWLYDGTGVSLQAKLPANFQGYDMCVVNGVALLAGSFVFANQTQYQSAVFYYANGNIGLLWKANKPNTNLTHPTVAPWHAGAVIADETTGNLMYYEPSTGGISTIATFTTGSLTQVQRTVSCKTALLMTRNSATNTLLFPVSSGAASASGTLTSSLYDFDSSLTKYFRGVTVEFDSAVDGNGGSVDIAYQLNSVDGAFTSLQVGAASGTEYFVNQTGQSLSVKVTLNKGTSTLGPVVKRVYVRAAPQLQTFLFNTYMLDLSGIGFKDPVRLNDGSYHPLSGHEQAANLRAAFTATSPFTITDRFSTFTGICDTTPSASNPAGGCEIYEMREGNDSPAFSGGFAAKVTVRQV